ncbi:hypothetical protein, partial [Rhodomicrobium vannielii]|uniref:hypothetical protein n=1 Tax=Rhodomicrobium vannielii TaxID=1069 RepID=UPI001AEEDD6E
MQSCDIEICYRIGQLLYDTAPDTARKIVMRAKLAPEGDAVRFEFDSINESGEVNWFLERYPI